MINHLGAVSSTGVPRPGELQSFGSVAFTGALACASSLHYTQNVKHEAANVNVDEVLQVSSTHLMPRNRTEALKLPSNTARLQD